MLKLDIFFTVFLLLDILQKNCYFNYLKVNFVIPVMENPFEDDSVGSNDLNNNNVESTNIELWIETNGSKKLTYISGWNVSSDILKEIKKKKGCNGIIKNGIIQLQGDHIRYIYDLLLNTHFIDKSFIKIKG